MGKEKAVHELRFGIKVTKQMLENPEDYDDDYFYNVRIPIETDKGLKDVYIEADNEKEACKIAELIEHGGMVDIRNPL